MLELLLVQQYLQQQHGCPCVHECCQNWLLLTICAHHAACCWQVLLRQLGQLQTALAHQPLPLLLQAPQLQALALL
jgi:predicted lipoprotein with Yx(FWY)xxD motif